MLKKIKGFMWKQQAPIIFIFLLIIFSFGHLVYAVRTNTFFSVDDFFEISYFDKYSIIQFVPDFLIHGDMNEFTRIVGFVAFALIQKLFGLNHYAFDTALFLTNTFNLILLFFVVKKLTKNDLASFFVSLIFNKNYLFYYSNIHENLLAMFCILTIFFFLYYPKKFYLSFISFVLAVFTKETAVTVPLVLYAISFFYKLDRKKIFYLLLVSIAFGIYAGYFFYTKKIAGDNFIYTPAVKLIDLFRGYLYFVDYKILILCLSLSILFKKYKLIPLLATVFITLTPASLLVNRREMYYIYMPFLYLMMYVSLFLPKINFKSSLIPQIGKLSLYLIIFLVFGGRSIFPKIAWQEFPNWQKVSIDSVLDRVESGSNDFSDLNLERDAKLMIGSGTTDLFLKERKKND